MEETSSESLCLCSPLGAVPKKDRGKFRLILDLRYLNEFLKAHTFAFEDIKLVRTLFQPEDHLFTFDLKDAYYHIPIASCHRPFLGFSWHVDGHQKFFQFTCLPFGLRTAPYIFSKVTRPLVRHWRIQGVRIFMYLDDGTGGDQPFDRALSQSLRVREDIYRSGFRLNDKKSNFHPRQCAIALGTEVDTVQNRISASPERVAAFRSTLQTVIANSVRVRLLARVAGMLASMSMTLGPVTRLQTRAIHSQIAVSAELSWESSCVLQNDTLAELLFWEAEFHAFHGQPIWPRHPQCLTMIFSDASDTGWGCHCPADVTLTARGEWPSDGRLRAASSTKRELRAILLSLQALVGSLQKRNVCISSDNQNVVRILMHGSRVRDLHQDSLAIFNLCNKHEIGLEASWVPRDENVVADSLSRITDNDDWQLAWRVFTSLNNRWGPHTVDRFASHLSALLPRFNSRWWCPGCEAVNAFAQSWSGENNWCAPPPRLLGELIVFLRHASCHATVIVPEWPSAPWWPAWHPASSWCSLVKDALVLSPFPGLCIPQGQSPSIFGPAAPQFNLIALRICSKGCCVRQASLRS